MLVNHGTIKIASTNWSVSCAARMPPWLKRRFCWYCEKKLNAYWGSDEHSNALSELEQQGIVTLCTCKAYAHLPPSQIVPQLVDEGRHVASEATFYRELYAAGQQHRSRAKRPHRHEAPTTYIARAENQVWSWDITYPPSPIRKPEVGATRLLNLGVILL